MTSVDMDGKEHKVPVSNEQEEPEDPETVNVVTANAETANPETPNHAYDVNFDDVFYVVGSEEVQSEKLEKRHTGKKVKDCTIAEWQVKYPWLEALTDDAGNRRLRCKVCAKAKAVNVWGREGSPNVQISTINRHNDSLEHENAEKKLAFLVTTNIDCDGLGSDDEGCHVVGNVSDKDKRLFYAVFYAAKEDLASDKVNSLIELQAKSAVGGGDGTVDYKNVSWDTVKDVQSCIASVLEKELLKQLKESPVFGLVLDGIPDLGVQKKLALTVRYLDKGEPMSKFMCALSIDDVSVETVVQNIADKLNNNGLDIGKLVSLSTDGASVILKSKTGFGAEFRARCSPFLAQTNALAHTDDHTIVTNLTNLLEPATVLTTSDLEIRESLNALSTFYGKAKKVKFKSSSGSLDVQDNDVVPLLDGEALVKEWPLLHGMIKGSYKDCRMAKVCKRVLNLHRNLLPNFAKLCQVALCLSTISTASAPAMSMLTILKSKFRSSLKTDSIDTLMKIVLLGPTLADFDPTESVNLWHSKKKRRPGRLSRAYMPRAKKMKFLKTIHQQ